MSMSKKKKESLSFNNTAQNTYRGTDIAEICFKIVKVRGGGQGSREARLNCCSWVTGTLRFIKQFSCCIYLKFSIIKFQRIIKVNRHSNNPGNSISGFTQCEAGCYREQCRFQSKKDLDVNSSSAPLLFPGLESRLMTSIFHSCVVRIAR